MQFCAFVFHSSRLQVTRIRINKRTKCSCAINYGEKNCWTFDEAVILKTEFSIVEIPLKRQKLHSIQTSISHTKKSRQKWRRQHAFQIRDNDRNNGTRKQAKTWMSRSKHIKITPLKNNSIGSRSTNQQRRRTKIAWHKRWPFAGKRCTGLPENG